MEIADAKKASALGRLFALEINLRSIALHKSRTMLLVVALHHSGPE